MTPGTTGVGESGGLARRGRPPGTGSVHARLSSLEGGASGRANGDGRTHGADRGGGNGPAAGAAVIEAVAQARDRLVRAGVPGDDAGLDAAVLARHVLGWDQAAWLVRRRDAAPPGFAARYAPLVARRADREPVASITGRREFWGLTFAVGPAVLTPRPETELIVETARARLADRTDAPLAIADVGTGSGCLAVALAHECPRAAITAVDVSPAALAVARRNAAAHGVARRIRWVAAPFADWLAGRPGAPAAGEGAADDRRPGPFDLIVANLPYVPTGDLAALAPEVRRHDPQVALDGGPDGLDPMRRLLRRAPGRLRAGASILAEIGAGQADAVRRLVAAAPDAALADIRCDLRGLPRVAVIVAAGVPDPQETRR